MKHKRKILFLLSILLFYFLFLNNAFAASYTHDEMTSSAEDVFRYTSDNSKIPKSVTINNKTATDENYLHMLTKSVVKISEGNKSGTSIPSHGVPPNPQGTSGGTLTKSQYLTMAKNINSFYSSNGRAPNFATINGKDVRYESLVYGFSKILYAYERDGTLPSEMSFPLVTGISTSGITVDTTAPSTSKNLADGSYNTIKTLVLTASDNKDASPKIYYTINGGSTLSATKTVSITLNQGTQTIKYYAKDAKGNTESTKTATYKIDLTAPSVSNNLAEGYYAYNTAVVLTASDNMDSNPTLYYRINNNNWVSVAKTVTIKLAQGINNISYYAKDIAGNTGPTTTTDYVPFDNQIVIAANTVKTYIETNHKLPETVSLNGQTISTSRFLKVLVEAVLAVDKFSGFSIVSTDGISNPQFNQTENLKYGNISGGDYIPLAEYIKNFIDTNGYSPNIVATSLGEMNFESLVYLYSKVLASYNSSCNSFDTYVEVIPWLAVTNPNKIYNFNSQKVFDSLQAAIDDPDTLEFDLIILGKNIQENVLLSKTLRIAAFSGKNITISGLNYNLPILTITPDANGSAIFGITFTGSSTGILINNTMDIKIFDNIINNCENGIYLIDSYNVSIIGNNILKNSVNGIFASDGTEYIFGENNIYNNTIGLNLNNIVNFTVSSNSFINNQYGIKVSNSSGDINFNQITNNRQGLSVNGNCDINATNNWWGKNNPNLNGVDMIVMDDSTVICDRWLVLSYDQTTSDMSDRTGSTYNQNVTVDLLHNNMGEDTSKEGNLPDGLTIKFFNNLTNTTVNTALSGGRASVILKSTKSGINPIIISLDSQNITYNLNFASITSYTIINNRTGTGYATIQEAIDSTNTVNGDTIILSSGIYTENIVITKKLVITGNITEKTILQSSDEAETGIITIRNSGSGSTIQYLTIMGSTSSYAIGLNNASNINMKFNTLKDSYCGIYLFNSSNITIANNIITDNTYGILISNSSSTLNYINIKNNSLFNNTGAICILNTNKTEISGNIIKENWNGIYIENVSNIKISSNLISFQGWEGINAKQSVNVTIINNELRNNTIGIINFDSENLIMTENVFSNNTITDLAKINSSDIVIASTIYSCGPATLATLLRQLGINTTEAEIAQLAKLDETGTSIKGLLDAANSMGLHSKAVKIEFENLKPGYIVLLNNKNSNTMHYTLIKNITETTVHLSDSSLGDYEISIEKFKELFSGYAIIVSTEPINLNNTTELSTKEITEIKGNLQTVLIKVRKVVYYGHFYPVRHYYSHKIWYIGITSYGYHRITVNLGFFKWSYTIRFPVFGWRSYTIRGYYTTYRWRPTKYRWVIHKKQIYDKKEKINAYYNIEKNVVVATAGVAMVAGGAAGFIPSGGASGAVAAVGAEAVTTGSMGYVDSINNLRKHTVKYNEEIISYC